jgi:hypothetical protein
MAWSYGRDGNIWGKMWEKLKRYAKIKKNDWKEVLMKMTY